MNKQHLHEKHRADELEDLWDQDLWLEWKVGSECLQCTTDLVDEVEGVIPLSHPQTLCIEAGVHWTTSGIANDKSGSKL